MDPSCASSLRSLRVNERNSCIMQRHYNCGLSGNALLNVHECSAQRKTSELARTKVQDIESRSMAESDAEFQSAQVLISPKNLA